MKTFRRTYAVYLLCTYNSVKAAATQSGLTRRVDEHNGFINKLNAAIPLFEENGAGYDWETPSRPGYCVELSQIVCAACSPALISYELSIKGYRGSFLTHNGHCAKHN